MQAFRIYLIVVIACLGSYTWTYHVNMCLRQRFIARETIIAAAESYEIVAAYPDDKYFSSYLLLGRLGEEAFHVLFGTKGLSPVIPKLWVPTWLTQKANNGRASNIWPTNIPYKWRPMRKTSRDKLLELD